MIPGHDVPDPEAARMITENLQDFDRQHERRYASLGLMALEVERRELWRHVTDVADGFPCRSFARWLRQCCPHSSSTIYAALADVKALADVPAEAVSQIRESNFDTMKLLSTAVRRDPSVLQAASQVSNAEFVAYVQKEHPNQAIEARKPLRFSPTVSQRGDIDEALILAAAGEDVSLTESLWRVCVEYNLMHLDPRGFEELETDVVQ